MTILKQLENSLTIHLKEIHTSPIISHWVWYRVGSRNEQQGQRGISHWVEHMQFKGTDQYPPGLLDRVISREGGMWNAFTSQDWTAYFQVMPASKIDIALSLEADRMQKSRYEPEEVDSERTVILSELEGNENEPLFRLNTAIHQAAFAQHPYRYEIIGEREDLLSINRKDLYDYYRKAYTPANAVVTVAGDFESEEMLEKLAGIYGGIPSGSRLPQPTFQEPPLAEERRVEMSGAGSTTYLQVSYRAPKAAHEDFFPLNVLDSLLTGPSGLSMFGGGSISNRTSRLYRALVESDLAVALHGGMQATIDPYLYSILVIVHPDRQPEETLQALDEQMALICSQPVTGAEIDRAIKQAKALFAYSTESVTNQAFWLGYTQMFSDYSWFEEYIQRLESATPARLQESAQRYLDRNRRVVGIYRPAANGGQA